MYPYMSIDIIDKYVPLYLGILYMYTYIDLWYNLCVRWKRCRNIRGSGGVFFPKNGRNLWTVNRPKNEDVPFAIGIATANRLNAKMG